MKNEVLTNLELEEDKDLTIRPQKLDDYIGQSEVKENISIFIKSALILLSFISSLALFLLIFRAFATTKSALIS